MCSLVRITFIGIELNKKSRTQNVDVRFEIFRSFVSFVDCWMQRRLQQIQINIHFFRDLIEKISQLFAIFFSCMIYSTNSEISAFVHFPSIFAFFFIPLLRFTNFDSFVCRCERWPFSHWFLFIWIFGRCWYPRSGNLANGQHKAQTNSSYICTFSVFLHHHTPNGWLGSAWLRPFIYSRSALLLLSTTVRVLCRYLCLVSNYKYQQIHLYICTKYYIYVYIYKSELNIP